MALFLRLLLMSFVVLSVVYVCLLFYARARKHSELEEAWLVAGQPGERSHHIDEKLEEYTVPLRRKLFWGVYVIPLCAIAVLIYVTNFA